MPKFRLLLLIISIFCISAFPALASDCTAPVLHYSISGLTASDAFGSSVAAIGDVDGDGKTDFAVGIPNASPNGIGAAGAVYVYSGKDGSFLYRINGTAQTDAFGQAIVGLGDINKDGKPDFIIRAFTYASIYSAPDGVLLAKINLPAASFVEPGFATAGDVNGDGTVDLIIGASSASTVFVYSGAGDSLLYQIIGESDDGFGFSVSAIGDINSDGNTDFVVGAPFAETTPGEYALDFGAVYVYSGLDGQLLRQVNGTYKWEHLGWSVSPVGDLDEDGKTDFIVGAPFDERWSYPLPLPDSAYAYAQVFSGSTGTPLHKIRGKSLNHFGSAVRGMGDVDGDGALDFAIGEDGDGDAWEPNGDPFGTVFVYSGRDGNLIWRARGDRPYDNFGFSITNLGDLNGDGRTDLIVGDYGIPFTDTGRVYVFVSKTVPKGDLDLDSTLTIADVTNLLNVVFVDNSAAVSPCTADLNCDGAFSPADVTLLLKRVFLQTPLPCS